MAPAPNGSVPARVRREGGFTPNQRVDRVLNIRTSALTAVALAAITGSGAAADTGTDGRAWYLGGGLGAGRADNGDAVGGRVDFDLGRPMAMLVGGMSLGDRWRLELDAAHRGNDSEVVYFPGGGADVQPDSDSTLTARSIGASVLRRFDAGTGFRPYLGAGVAVEFISEAFWIPDASCPLVEAVGAVFASARAAIATFAVVLFGEDEESPRRCVSVAGFNGDFLRAVHSGKVRLKRTRCRSQVRRWRRRTRWGMRHSNSYGMVSVAAASCSRGAWSPKISTRVPR